MIIGNERLHRWSPHRAPEWRWLSAQQITRQPRRSPALERDRGVQQAVMFLRKLEACRDDMDHEELFDSEPDAYLALTFWVDPSRYRQDSTLPRIEESRRQAALEAYLLADLKHDEIASRLCVTQASVELYEDWFFDFRQRAGSIQWISTYGIRGDVSGTSGCSFDNLLRLYGWRYGVTVVDEMLAGTGYSEKTLEIIKNETLQHLTKNAAMMSRQTYHQGVTFEAAARAQELQERAHQARVAAGHDFRSDDERNYFKTLELDMAQQSWQMQGILPADIEASIPKVEHRLSVKLGYEPDLSSVKP